MKTETLKTRVEWDLGPIPELGDAEKTIPHADPEFGEVTLHREIGPLAPTTYKKWWIRYIRRSYAPEDGATPGNPGDKVIHLQPVSGHCAFDFGQHRKVQCHRKCSGYENYTADGYHTCGACGYPAWVEVHGMADGMCECCGHSG